MAFLRIIRLFLAFNVLLLLDAHLVAQEYAPVGASWTYEVLRRPSDASPVAFRYTATHDTIVSGQTCRSIQGYRLYADGHKESMGEEIVSGNGDSVYVYVDDTFHLIFDFSAQTGDTLRVIGSPFNAFFVSDEYVIDSFSYRIDSVRTEYIDGDSLALQYVSYLGDPFENTLQWGFQNTVDYVEGTPGRILQGVGSIGRESMLGTSIDITYIFDFVPDGLTCYQDSLRDYKFSITDCEALIDFYTSDYFIPAILPFKGSVYPNPFTESVHINYDHEAYTINTIEVRNLLGQSLAEYNGKDTTLNLAYLEPGVYQLLLTDQTGEQFFFTILKP